MHHPWRALRAHADWTLVWARPASGVRAEAHWASQTIWIDPRLFQAERRSALAHELAHVERGPFPAWALAREEAAADALAARRLIPLDALLDALAWSSSPWEVADELWVDLPTLEARIASLTPDEIAAMHARLGE